MLEMQLTTMKHLDGIGQSELVTSIAQEFNQPLSSIIGYTDLLLGESVGLLGAMQRKFLERVKASTERLRILMDELVEVLAIDDGKLDQTLTIVDLEAVIDDAVGSIINQISEKNITMRVDLPEKLPEIQANRDAILQILSNLLQNACLATPADGEIRLYSRLEQKNEAKYLLVAVSDQGGGIGQVDIPRVFSRRYKVENPLIQGIGDTGVGLSIVKSLVELQRGRVWVDTQEGIGSTFSVLLPLNEEHSDLESTPQGKQAS
jgi:signal transduction histidine kinase